MAPDLYDADRTLEFAATFSGAPGQNIGFAASDALDGPVAVFYVKSSDGQLYARSVRGTKVLETQLVGIDWLGNQHRYTVEWNAGNAKYFVDGTLVVTHTNMAWGAVTMRPAIVDSSLGDGALTVDWMRMTPYASSGGYTSAVFDAGAAVQWLKLTASTDKPAGTTATLMYRTGDTPAPDGSWTAFAPPGTGGALVGSGRYIQFAVQQTSTTPARTPATKEVTILYKY